jgi:plasmid maintenance system killer protein
LKKIKIMKNLSILILTLCFHSLLMAQELKFEWLNRNEHKKNIGNLDNVFHVKDNIVYQSISDPKTPSSDKYHVKLIAIDKTTNNIVYSNENIDNNPKDEKTFSELTYFGSYVSKNAIFVFWQTSNQFKDKKYELYCQTFNFELKNISPLKKIFTLQKNKKSISDANFFVTSNKNYNNIFVGYEYGFLSFESDENLKIDYIELKSDLTMSKPLKIEFPFKKMIEPHFSLNYVIKGDYKQIDNDLIFVESQNNFIISSLNGSKLNIPHYFEKKFIHSIKVINDEKKIKLIGTYTENESEILTEKKPGIFSIEVDKLSLIIINSNYYPFNETQISLLYPKLEKKNQFILQGSNKIDKNLMNYEIFELIPRDGDYLLLMTKVLEKPFIIRSQNGTSEDIYSYKENVAPVLLKKDGNITTYALTKRNSIDENKSKINDIYTMYDKNYCYFIFPYGDFPWEEREEDPLSFIYYSVFDFNSGVTTRKKIIDKSSTKKERKSFYLWEFSNNDNNELFIISEEYETALKSSHQLPKSVGRFSIITK